MDERMIEVGDVELCTEPFGDPADPPILLMAGLGSSMLWWDEEVCRRLAEGGRFVIRYDHRDTGRSQSFEPGRPGYTGADLDDDAMGVLDAYAVGAAHLVGVSAGGGSAQLLAVRCPDRVRSLVLISTSPATPGDRSLPPPSDDFGRFVSTAEVDWSDPESVIEHLVAYARVLAGDQRPFDDLAVRAFIRRDVERTRDVAALQNHDLIVGDESIDGSIDSIGSIVAPTLVMHGSADPMFPIAHGEALAAEIPGARLHVLDGAGHGVDPADHAEIAAAILTHTAPQAPI